MNHSIKIKKNFYLSLTIFLTGCINIKVDDISGVYRNDKSELILHKNKTFSYNEIFVIKADINIILQDEWSRGTWEFTNNKLILKSYPNKLKLKEIKVPSEKSGLLINIDSISIEDKNILPVEELSYLYGIDSIPIYVCSKSSLYKCHRYDKKEIVKKDDSLFLKLYAPIHLESMVKDKAVIHYLETEKLKVITEHNNIISVGFNIFDFNYSNMAKKKIKFKNRGIIINNKVFKKL